LQVDREGPGSGKPGKETRKPGRSLDGKWSSSPSYNPNRSPLSRHPRFELSWLMKESVLGMEVVIISNPNLSPFISVKFLFTSKTIVLNSSLLHSVSLDNLSLAISIGSIKISVAVGVVDVEDVCCCCCCPFISVNFFFSFCWNCWGKRGTSLAKGLLPEGALGKFAGVILKGEDDEGVVEICFPFVVENVICCSFCFSPRNSSTSPSFW